MYRMAYSFRVCTVEFKKGWKEGGMGQGLTGMESKRASEEYELIDISVQSIITWKEI